MLQQVLIMLYLVKMETLSPNFEVVWPAVY